MVYHAVCRLHGALEAGVERRKECPFIVLAGLGTAMLFHGLSGSILLIEA